MALPHVSTPRTAAHFYHAYLIAICSGLRRDEAGSGMFTATGLNTSSSVNTMARQKITSAATAVKLPTSVMLLLCCGCRYCCWLFLLWLLTAAAIVVVAAACGNKPGWAAGSGSGQC